MRPSALAVLGTALALFVGAGTFVALDARVGASGKAPVTTAPEPVTAPEATVEELDEAPGPEAEQGSETVEEVPETSATPPPALGETPPPVRQEPAPRPAPQPDPPQTAPAPRPQAPAPVQPACDPAPLIRRITQLTVRECPSHTDPDRKRACYAEIERLNSELEACSS